MEAEGSVSASTDFNVGLSVFEANAELDDTYGKSVGQEKAMAFAKYGKMEVTYTLGDGDPYDKFVIHVSNDKRFGTPVFKHNWRIKMPRRAQTTVEKVASSSKQSGALVPDNNFIPPDHKALFDLVITNESPYRRAYIWIVANFRKTIQCDFGGNMMDLSFTLNGVPSIAPFQSLVPLHDIPSVDTNGNLKYTRLSLNIQKGQFSQKV